MRLPDARPTRRLLWKRRRPWYFWFTLSLVLTLIAGAVAETITERVVARRYPAPGQMVDVGGYELHLNCTGQGSPTVILEAGLGGWSSYWYAVQPQVSKFTRVCSYDRAGYGWSEASTRPRTLRNMVDDLHRVVVQAKLDGPYVLVGHSLGGVIIQQYAASYPLDVAGIVLVDSSHEEQRTRLEAITGSNVRSYPVKEFVGAAFSYVWFTRLVLPLFDPGNDRVPQDVANMIVDLKARPTSMSAQFVEARDLDDYFAEARKSKSTSLDVPMIVLTGLKGRSIDEQRFWMDLQTDLAQRSAHGEQRSVLTSGHFIQWDEPDAVTDALRDMVKTASTKQ